MARQPRTRDPTPQEIKRACEVIQEGWTESERRRRAGRGGEVVEVEVIDSRELFGHDDDGAH